MNSLKRFCIVIFAVCSVIITLSITSAIIRGVWFDKSSSSTDDQVAVISLRGVILDSYKFLEVLDEAVEDDNVKAIVFRVNSPGGVVAPSEEIYHGILEADKIKPVIVSMGSVAASGGYYAALGGRKIFANPGTLTGSIGVIMEFANTAKLYEWAKIKRFSLKAGKFKDIGSEMRDMTPSERAFLRGMLENIYMQFTNTVALRRNLKSAQIPEVAEGKIFTGLQAKLNGLVDEIGGIQDAIKEAKAVAEISEDAEVIYPMRKKDFFERLIDGNVRFNESWIEQYLSQFLTKVSGGPANTGFQVMYLAPLSVPTH